MTEPAKRRGRLGRSVATLRLLGLVASVSIFSAACGGDTGVDLAAGGPGDPAVVDAPPTLQSEPGPEVRVATGLGVTLTPILEAEEPIAMATHPTTGAVFIATKKGIVAEVDLETGEVIEIVLEIGAGLAGDFIEQGLLGIAFSPDGQWMYLNFTDKDYATVIAEYPAMDGVIGADEGRSVLRVDQPAANHNGGHLVFGPDGLLYIGFGDGGGSNDEFGNGQNPETLLGTIARIDPRPRGDAPYAVPADNPFANGGGRPEIYVWGARNPWRFSFDRLTGDLWIADVGQDALEEVTVLYASEGRGRGTNLGWPDVEGSLPFAAAGPPAQNYAAPIHEYGRDDGCSVTGGHVYRGEAIPELTGHYVFGDYCTSELWALASSESQGVIERIDLGASLREKGLVSFFEDARGELYLLGFDNTVYRIDPE